MDAYLHIRVVISILVGLSITHLLQGVAGIVGHPHRTKTYSVHLMWVLFMLIYLLHFWWWEFRLEKISTWTFPIYLFLNFYGIILYLLCSILFPTDMTDYDGFETYFYSRRRWFFGIMALMFVVDVWDTAIKGRAHLRSLGFEYDVRTFSYIVCCLIAIKTKNRYFHAAFAILAILYEFSFILRLFLKLE